MECIAIADEATPPDLFLEPYVSGLYPTLNPIPTSFNICYEAQDAIDAYGFSLHSTWVLINQSGEIAYRMNGNLEPIMIEIIIEEIDALLDIAP